MIENIIISIKKAPFVGQFCNFTTSTSVNSTCFNNQCKNNGTCYEISSTQYGCICPTSLNLPGQPVQIGYSGPFCESIAQACAPNPCLNNGLCTPLPSGSAYCFCTGKLNNRSK